MQRGQQLGGLLRGPARGLRHLLTKKWRQLDARPEAALHRIDCGTRERPFSLRKRLNDGDAHLAAFAAPPPAVEEYFDVGINCPVPVLLWPRTGCPGPAHDGPCHGSVFLDERLLIPCVASVTVDPSTQDRTIGRQLMEAVLQRDADKAREVIAGDREIDHLELEVEETVIRLLATQQPMARDLRFLTAAMKISNDLERVGDHAVNIAQSAQRLMEARPIIPEPELLEMARQARTMLADALDAFVRGDAQAGRAICRRDDSVDALHQSMFRILLTHMMEDPHIIGTAMDLFLVSRNLERVADLERLPLPFPLFVKPVAEGSGKGIFVNNLCDGPAPLAERVLFLLERYDQPVLVETYLPGPEFTVAILGNNGDVRCLPIVAFDFDTLPAGAPPVYGYEAKWIWDTRENPLAIFQCPPTDVPDSLCRETKRVALDAYRALGCRDWCRIDVRVDRFGVPNVVELNPLPGIIPDPAMNSCFPKAARVAGYSYDELIQEVLRIAWRRTTGREIETLVGAQDAAALQKPTALSA